MKTNHFFFCGNERSSFHNSIRHRGLRFGSAAFKSDAPDGDDDKEAKEELLLRVRNTAKEVLKNDNLYKEFTTMNEEWKKLPLEAIRSLTDEKTGVLARFSALDAKMIELETRAAASGQKNLTLRGQIEDWAKENKVAIDAIRAGKKVDLEPMILDIRVANSPMLPANTYVAGSVLPVPYYEPGINDIVRPQPTFWDYLTKGKTSQPAYGWINKTNVQGAAAFIGPGVLKPGISFQLDTQISTYKKIAVTSKVAQELLWDFDGMETLIKDELRYQILIELNTKLISNPGSTTEPTGIRDLSVAFTQTGLETTNPTYSDAIRAVVAQMRNGNLTGAITIFINPIDAANMDMAKATTSGVYLLPPFVTASGRVIAGATIVEDASIPVGFFQAAFLQYYRILIYKPLMMTWGWENDDFTRNLVTYLAEMALHQFFNEQYTGAFVYDSFDNVLAMIDAAIPLLADSDNIPIADSDTKALDAR
jgi:HK97 family phage major capsid protein